MTGVKKFLRSLRLSFSHWKTSLFFRFLNITCSNIKNGLVSSSNTVQFYWFIYKFFQDTYIFFKYIKIWLVLPLIGKLLNKYKNIHTLKSKSKSRLLKNNPENLIPIIKTTRRTDHVYSSSKCASPKAENVSCCIYLSTHLSSAVSTFSKIKGPLSLLYLPSEHYRLPENI